MAAKALKSSLPEEDRQELWDYLERDVKSLCPLEHGDAMVIDGDGDWEWLIVAAAVPHHTNDVVLSKTQFSSILKRSVINSIKSSLSSELGSIAMTVIADGYRLPTDMAIRSMAEAMHECIKEDIIIEWCILDRDKFDEAVKVSQQLSLPFEIS